jgi:homospermidine synthase
MPPVTTTFADVVKELANEIKMTDMPTPLSFSDRTQNDGSHKIEFQHYCNTWSIKIPAEFPEKPAEVYKQERPYGTPEKKTITDSSKSKHEQKSLVSSDLIMLAIRSNCYCSSCRNNSSCKQLRN